MCIRDREYTEYVYNEYRWKGRNYKGQHAPEIVEPVSYTHLDVYKRQHIDKAEALVTKFRNQKPPENATREQVEQWEKNKLLSLIHIFFGCYLAEYVIRRN